MRILVFGGVWCGSPFEGGYLILKIPAACRGRMKLFIQAMPMPALHANRECKVQDLGLRHLAKS